MSATEKRAQAKARMSSAKTGEELVAAIEAYADGNLQVLRRELDIWFRIGADRLSGDVLQGLRDRPLVLEAERIQALLRKMAEVGS